MQALGAYGKLGVGDGKKAFLGHIPHALENLRGGDFPISHLKL